MATTIDTEAYKAAREFIATVDRVEDDRHALQRALGQGGAISENMLSAMARLNYELGQLLLAERDFRRTVALPARHVAEGRTR